MRLDLTDCHFFHCCLALKAFQIAGNGSNGEGLSTMFIRYGAVEFREAAVDLNCIPSLGVAHVIDPHVVVLAPEKGHSVESFALAEDIFCGYLALTFRDDPVLDTYFLSRVQVWPTSNVTCRKDPRDAGLEEFVDHNSAIHCQPGPFRQRHRRMHADAQYDEVSVQSLSII